MLKVPSVRVGVLFARAAVLAGIVVLICVPALTRAGQRLETSSRTLSFRNVDCPPKKVTVSPAPVIADAVPLEAPEVTPVSRLTPAPDTTLPRAPFLATPRPLRAPPATRLS